MYRKSIRLILLASLLQAVSFAQNSHFNGIWVAPDLSANGPTFYALTFNVTGNTFTGTINGGGRGDERITGKIENGHISFSLPKQEMGGVTLERSYTGTLKDDKHLELVQESRAAGVKVTRKPPLKNPPNTLEGEWGLEKLLSPVFHVQGDNTLTGEISDRFLLTRDREVLTDALIHHPFTGGQVHGNEFSYQYKNKWNNAVICTGTFEGNDMVVTYATTASLHAVRIADKQK